MRSNSPAAVEFLKIKTIVIHIRVQFPPQCRVCSYWGLGGGEGVVRVEGGEKHYNGTCHLSIHTQ